MSGTQTTSPNKTEVQLLTNTTKINYRFIGMHRKTGTHHRKYKPHMHKNQMNTSQPENTSSKAQQIVIHNAHHAQSKYRCINKHNFVTIRAYKFKDKRVLLLPWAY